MTTTIPTLQSASLQYREGSSDKEYHAAIEPKGEGYLVTFAYGRRGNTLNTGTKTNYPVSLHEATKVFDKLVASKLAKGYQYSAASAGETKPYRQSGDEGRDSGIRCQLLNAVEQADVSLLLRDHRHCLQEKHDGRRLMVRKKGDEITGINRRGLIIAIPDAIRDDNGHSSTMQVPVEIHGSPPGTAFNARYLADALDIGSTLCLSDELSPGICRHPTGRFCVIMPMRVTIPADTTREIEAAPPNHAKAA